MTSTGATAPTHVVLIRGINVGGKNPVPMARLRASLEERGYDAVATYIQSGNVVLAAAGGDEAQVSRAVETALAEDFGVDTVVLTLSAEALRAAVSEAPETFGSEPDAYHYDVAFLMPGITGHEALPHFGTRDGVDTAWAGARAVYFRRLSAERTKSRLSSVMSSPLYKKMTVRNWRTCTKLVAMLDDSGIPGT
ncbi:MAG: DUF1697 domain-containing protein [Demequinaceae bacterium]|nr:DUF1697 domain-containing protein [Demequinaceae bacterium]